MGNICSSSPKNCKDAESEMSEGGNNDSESDSNCPKTVKVPEKNLSDKIDNICTPVLDKTVNPINDINEFSHHPNCDEVEKVNKGDGCSKAIICPITKNSTEQNRKIIFYIVMSSKADYKKHMSIINRFLPDLSTRCKLKGFELAVSFTHYEILSKNCNNDPMCLHEELEIRYDEIKRHKDSYIVPILFFGSVLETPHIPMKIDEKDFSFLLSITSKEQSDLLQKFYAADILSLPSTCYSLNSHLLLKKEETEQILETLITHMPINLKTTYLATAVEKIITNVILDSKDLTNHCVWIQGESSPESCSADNPVVASEVSTRNSNLNRQLRDEIPVRNIIPPLSSSDEDEEILDLLGHVLKSNITSLMDKHSVKCNNSRNTIGMCRPFVDEIEAVRRHSIAIGTSCTSTFDVKDIVKYIQSESLFPLVVFGSPEEGISILSSQIALNLEKWIEHSHLVLRYAGLTILSSEMTSLLASIADQISILVDGKPCHAQYGIDNYKRTIEGLLDKCNMSIVIIIDSVDKILNAKDFDWLPNISKPSTKIILTVTNNGDFTEHSAAKELTKREVPKENLLPLLRDPTNTMNRTDSKSDLNSNPLKAKLILKLSSLGVKVNCDDSEKLIENLFIKVESKVDVRFLEILLLIVAISPYGIYETDCVNIFEDQAKIERACSLVIWSRFCWLMGPMLVYTNSIKLVDCLFKQAIFKRYPKNILQVQNAAKRYFENQPDSFYDAELKSMSLNAEKYLKVPQYDLAALSGCEESILQKFFTNHYFTDLSWIYNKITSSGCFQYLNDIIIAEESYKKTSNGFQHITLLKQFLIQHMTQLSCDGSQFYTLFKVFLKNAIAKDGAFSSNDCIKNWTDTIDQLKLTYLERLTNDNQENNSNGNETYNEVVLLKESGYFVAGISTDCDEICVWDVHSGKKIRVLKSVPHPSLLCSIRNFEVAVLCQREIKVIDLHEGEYKATLKGVMNQKMPYFGLHDDDHLVCLSRNRMYVNLMNLKSGDCVTSFKAGEDRFLNSLIVSGNGRILVCGDESQKPFSLLVWHLTQRRLLYDLRIPHHDLFTALSAITYEGLYVSVVAKEIREPGPNFIVVYDLQSGTLFQKLKPACNTVAIAISQANGCVIAGLENAEILIWDLVTGNCRHTLLGHNAPVTFMKLDSLGSCLLSGDKDGRDLSLRLWELSTGKSLAVYSPPHKISSCEILDNGEYVILAIEETPGVVILQLKNYEKTKTQSEICPRKSIDCKIYTLKEH